VGDTLPSVTDLYDNPEFRAYAKRVRTELVPMIEDSALTVSLLPEGELDVKFAVELGLSILLDKPIIAVVKPGVKVSNKLVLVADQIVEGDMSTEEGKDKMAAAINAAIANLGEPPPDLGEVDPR
jgi:hypothetical protein